jgi:hypothetical protein
LKLDDLYPERLYPSRPFPGDTDPNTVKSYVQPTIDAAERLFVKNVNSSHVLWPRCLWQAIPLETALTLLKPYWPRSGMTVEGVRDQIMQDFVDSGLLDCTQVKDRTLTEAERKNTAIVRAAREIYSMGVGDKLDEEQAKGWLIYGYGDYVKIMGNSIRDKARAVCQCFLNRFFNKNIIAPGLRLTYALGRFLDAARRNPGGPEFLAIQRATRVKDFEEFKNEAWNYFAFEIIDSAIELSRCLDGAHNDMKTGLRNIMGPKDPEDISALYWFAEKSLMEYREKFLDIFDSHLRSIDKYNRPDIEERIYGKSWLIWKVGPVFGFNPEVNPTHHLGDYDDGRDPDIDCLQPFKTGTFGNAKEYSPVLDAKAGVGVLPPIFLSANQKKNTTKLPTGEFEFTYLDGPFSPVRVFYHDMRNLFARRLALDTKKETISSTEFRAWNELMQVLFLNKEIRDEYHAFIAPIDLEPVTGEQLALWNPETSPMPGIPLSFRAIRALNGAPKAVLQLNQHLRWWKVGTRLGGFYYYPSFDAVKYLAVTLGYAQMNAELSGLQLMQPRPDFTPGHEKPAVTGKGFYKHFNVWRERIDIDPENQDRDNPRSSKHPQNQGAQRQLPEPEAFKAIFDPLIIIQRADPVQQLLYEFCYPKEAAERKWQEAAEEWVAYQRIKAGKSDEIELNAWPEERSTRIWSAFDDDGAALLGRLRELAAELRRLGAYNGHLENLQTDLRNMYSIQWDVPVDMLLLPRPGTRSRP